MMQISKKQIHSMRQCRINCCIKYLVDEIEKFDEEKIPVLTANKSFVLGSTSDRNGIYNQGNCIIFDDFTTDCKYVDFDFKVKSSAIKILTVKKGYNLKLIFEKMQKINYPLGGHKRHYLSEYQYLPISIPPTTQEQGQIASVLSTCDP